MHEVKNCYKIFFIFFKTVSKPHNKCIKIEHVLIIYLFKTLIIKGLFFGMTLLKILMEHPESFFLRNLFEQEGVLFHFKKNKKRSHAKELY
jgi:hypothetical protein